MNSEPADDAEKTEIDGPSHEDKGDTAPIPNASDQTSLLLSTMPELAEGLQQKSESSTIPAFESPMAVSLETGSPPTPAAAERFYLDIENETDPGHALRRIDCFLEFYQLTESQIELIQQQRQVWEGREHEDFVKSGEHFVPASEVLKQREAFHQELAQVVQMAESGQSPDDIVVALDRISAEHDDAVISYYIAGLVKAIWLNESREALADFRRVLREVPDHAGTLNNIAICEMKTGDYGRALGNWRKAMEGNQLSVSRPEILHNIRYAHQLALSARTKMPTSFADAAARLLSENADETSQSEDKTTGFWRFSSWVAKPDQVVRIRTDVQTSVSPPSLQLPVESTHGISLGGELILVAEENLRMPYLGRSQHLKVVGANVRSSTHTAVCRSIATNEELGLTLLECPNLAAPVLSLSAGLPGNNEGVFLAHRNARSAIEFHEGISELPSDDIKCLFAAIASSGHQGAVGMPVFDGTGSLTGVLSPLASLQSGKNVRYAWSTGVIREFIKTSPAAPLAWPLINESESWETRQPFLADHIVEIQLCYPEETLSLNRAVRSKFNRSHYLADHSCFVCSGRSYIGCDQKGCANGSVSTKYREIVSRTIKGEPVYGTKIRTSRCPRCSGTGKLRCPNCSDGVEPGIGARPSGFGNTRGLLGR
ncbi:tetratricopeptide repeat protein [Rubinisphaera sp. JC750]|uniref:tetratricopeptide repeat protein n=1 Tax=Rubinisphaera sp. JC750 TaxID=2898658 RepID=UPI001F2A6558|nr:hypothetical protein [Rubinisphaera sp. JC750]